MIAAVNRDAVQLTMSGSGNAAPTLCKGGAEANKGVPREEPLLR